MKGLTKAPAVLTWEQAAALWVEWGGRHRPAQTVTDEITMCARLTGKGAEPYVWPAALGLRLVTVVGEEVARIRIKRPFTATSIAIDVNLDPKPPESLGDCDTPTSDGPVFDADSLTFSAPKAVDQYAEQTKAYNDALDDFMR